MYSPGASARESSASSSSSVSTSSSSDVLVECEDGRVSGPGSGEPGTRKEHSSSGSALPGWQTEFLTQLSAVVQAKKQDLAGKRGEEAPPYTEHHGLCWGTSWQNGV